MNYMRLLERVRLIEPSVIVKEPALIWQYSYAHFICFSKKIQKIEHAEDNHRSHYSLFLFGIFDAADYIRKKQYLRSCKIVGKSGDQRKPVAA